MYKLLYGTFVGGVPVFLISCYLLLFRFIKTAPFSITETFQSHFSPDSLHHMHFFFLLFQHREENVSLCNEAHHGIMSVSAQMLSRTIWERTDGLTLLVFLYLIYMRY